MLCFAAIGLITVFVTHAATSNTATETESGTVSGPASIVVDSTASGTHAVKFGNGATTASCPAAANTPGGADFWGGCWPGAFNTGYPHGLPGDTRTPVTLTSYTGSCTVAAGTTVTIDSKNVDCSSEGLFVYGTLTVKNSKVTGEIYENSDSAVLTVQDSEVDGLQQITFPTIGGGRNITLLRINAYAGEHVVMCYGNCNVQDSWLHDPHEAGSGPHQNGFLSNDGNGYVIRHNSVLCNTSGCTGDISFTDDGATYNATIDKKPAAGVYG